MLDLKSELFLNKDAKYEEFSKKLIPDTAYPIIGVRVPVIKNIAKKATLDDALRFISEKHVYYEEFMLHGLLINKFDKDTAYSLLEEFIPFIDNWAICDSLATSLKKLSKDKKTLLTHIKEWLKSSRTYTVRLGIVLLLAYFITDENIFEANSLVLTVNSEEYYINMAIAWYFSFALIKQYDIAVKIVESKILPKFVQNKTISKARESFRLSEEKKAYLKTLTV